MPKAKGYTGEYRLYLDEFESVSYMTRNNPIKNTEPGILPSVTKAVKAGRKGKVTLHEPAILGTPPKKKSRKVTK